MCVLDALLLLQTTPSIETGEKVALLPNVVQALEAKRKAKAPKNRVASVGWPLLGCTMPKDLHKKWPLRKAGNAFIGPPQRNPLSFRNFGMPELTEVNTEVRFKPIPRHDSSAR
jgi:hypothetical protein